MSERKGWPHSFNAMRVLMESNHTMIARIVGFVLIVHADENGQSYPSRDTIAREAGASVSGVRLGLRQLEAATDCRLKVTHVQRFKAGQKEVASNLYTLAVLPEATPVSTEPRLPRNPGYDMTPVTTCPTPGYEVTAPPVTTCPVKGSVERAHVKGSDLPAAVASAPSLPFDDDPLAEATKPKPSGASKDKAKPEDEPSSAHKQVTDCYFAEYEKARGVKPPFGKREGKSVNELLEKLGGDPDRACRCIRNAFTDPFWRDTATINTIAAEPARFDGNRAAARPQGRKPTAMVQPGIAPLNIYQMPDEGEEAES